MSNIPPIFAQQMNNTGLLSTQSLTTNQSSTTTSIMESSLFFSEQKQVLSTSTHPGRSPSLKLQLPMSSYELNHMDPQYVNIETSRKQKIENVYKRSATGGNHKISLVKSLRFKTMTVLISLFLLLMCLCLATLLTAFNVSFTSVERSIAMEMGKRASRALFDDFYMLNSKVFEYAAFGETVNVLLSNNATNAGKVYLNYYLHCQYQLAAKVNYALIYYMNGTLVQGLGCFKGHTLDKIPKELQSLNTQVGLQLKKGTEDPSTRNIGFFSPKETLFDLATSPSTLAQLQANSTILTNILLVAAMPIQDTDYLTSYGVLVFARYETTELLSDMSARTQLCLSLYNLDDSEDRYLLKNSLLNEDNPKQSTDAENMNVILTETATWSSTTIRGISSITNWRNNTVSQVQTLTVPSVSSSPLISNRFCTEVDESEGGRMVTFQAYSDIVSNKSIVLRTDFARDIYTLGITSFLITWGVMTAMIILLSIAIMIFIEFYVLRRIFKLTFAVRDITHTNNVKQRVPDVGGDELGLLSKDVNQMLESLDASQTILTEDNELMQRLLEKTSLSEQKSRVIMNSIEDFILTVDIVSGKLITINTSFETKIFNKKNEYISDYVHVFPTTEELLNYFNDISQTKARMDSQIVSSLGLKIPVSISVSRVKIMMEEGNVKDAYVVVFRNMSEQHLLRQAVQEHQMEMESFKQHLRFERVLFNPVWKERFRVS